MLWDEFHLRSLSASTADPVVYTPDDIALLMKVPAVRPAKVDVDRMYMKQVQILGEGG